MDLPSHEDGVYSIQELVKKGKTLIEEGDKSFLEAEIDPDAMNIILFTSGTTSTSKAVALSHKILCTNIMDIASVLEINENDTLLSFLPMHHAFECTIGLLYTLYKGSAIAFCDGMKHIADNLREYKITVMVSVPALFEAMYRKLLKGIEKQGKLPKLQKGLKISNALRKIHIDVRKKLFKEVHEALRRRN